VPPPDSTDAASEDTCDCDDPEVTSILSSWSNFISSRSMGKFLIFVRDCGLAGLPAWQTKKKDC
jgi:hypothetical protein